METHRKPDREAVATSLLKFCVWGLEGLKPGKRWERGGASRWIGAPLAAVALLFWAVYIVPITYALAIVCFYLESMFLWPKGWLKFNLFAGLVVLGFVSLSQGALGFITAIFFFWLASGAWKTIF